MVWATAAPDMATPRARPREAENAPATVVVQTVDLMEQETIPYTNQRNIHWTIAPLISPNEAISSPTTTSPGSASFRVPQRSIRMPKNGERIAARTAEMDRPD